MIDIDVVVQSMAKGLRNMLKSQRILMDVVYPQILCINYKRLLKDIEIIEADFKESDLLERKILNVNKLTISEGAND